MSLALKICRSNPRFVGDPIDVVTGANTDAPVDLVQRGPILSQWRALLQQRPYYDPFLLGLGTSHDFDRFLHRDLDGLRYEDPSGASASRPWPSVRTESAGVVSAVGPEKIPLSSPRTANPVRNLNSLEDRTALVWPDCGKVRTPLSSVTRLGLPTGDHRFSRPDDSCVHRPCRAHRAVSLWSIRLPELLARSCWRMNMISLATLFEPRTSTKLRSPLPMMRPTA